MVSFSDFGIAITGKTPSSSYPEDFGSEIPFVTPSDFFGLKYIKQTNRCLSMEGARKLRGKILPPDSVLITCIGYVGKVSMVRGESITNQQINSIIVNEQFDPHYVYYCLVNNYKLIRNAARGSTSLPLLNKTEFERLKCAVHFLKKDQLEISKLLSLLDNKIDLNIRINANLEAMAKTLHDFWFVQFDFPDANGKPYKTSGGKMVYNTELKREIPEAWSANQIGRIEPNIVTGKTPPTNNPDYFGGEIPFITIGDIRDNTFIVETEQTLSVDGANSQSNKYLPEGAICVTCIATPGLVGFVTRPSQTNQQINSIICSNIHNSYFMYFAIHTYFSGAKAKTGNTFANMNKGDFSEILLVEPPDNVRKLFHEKVDAIFEKIKVTSFENSQLVKLRDWLLPMLMNGQIRVI